jgi:hypothetical protein
MLSMQSTCVVVEKFEHGMMFEVAHIDDGGIVIGLGQGDNACPVVGRSSL